MTETSAVAEVKPPEKAPDKRAQAEVLLGDILRLMEYPARLDFKEMSDGGIGVAVHFEGELPGITPGKRSYLVDCLQFIVNKVVNRPNTEKRWVSLGVNAFPEPRALRQEPTPSAPRGAANGATPPAPTAPAAPTTSGNSAAPVASSAAPAAARSSAPRRPAPPVKERAEHRPSEHKADRGDERTLEVPADPLISRLATLLAEKSVKYGRFYAVMLLGNEDRARMLKAAAGVKGVSVRCEGEQHWRRVTFAPDKPTAMPKKAPMPDYDDEEE